MSKGSLVGTGGQAGVYLVGSFVNFVRSGKFKVARKGSLGGPWGFHLDWVELPKF